MLVWVHVKQILSNIVTVPLFFLSDTWNPWIVANVPEEVQRDSHWSMMCLGALAHVIHTTWTHPTPLCHRSVRFLVDSGVLWSQRMRYTRTLQLARIKLFTDSHRMFSIPRVLISKVTSPVETLCSVNNGTLEGLCFPYITEDKEHWTNLLDRHLASLNVDDSKQRSLVTATALSTVSGNVFHHLFPVHIWYRRYCHHNFIKII